MVTDNTKDTLIKISGLFWTEVHDDSGLGVRLDCANCLTKAKGITGIGV